MAETTKTGNDPKTVKPKPVMRSRVSLWFLLVVGILALVGGGAVLAVTGRSIPVPDWIVARAEARLTGALAGQGSVGIGGADLLVDEGWVPRLRLRDVVLASAAGTQMLSLPDIRVTLSRDDLLAGRFQPVQLRVLGANLTLRRTKAGAVTFDLSANEVAVPQANGLPGSVPAVLELIDRAFAVPELAKIEGIKAEGLMVTLDDARAGRVWRIENGRVDLTQTLQNMAVAIDLSWTHDVAKSSRAEMSFAAAKGSGTAQLSVRLSDVPAADVATQAPALAWLAPLEAPISGSLRRNWVDRG